MFKKTNWFLMILLLTGVDVTPKFRLKKYQRTDSNRDINFESTSERFLDHFGLENRLRIGSRAVSLRDVAEKTEQRST